MPSSPTPLSVAVVFFLGALISAGTQLYKMATYHPLPAGLGWGNWLPTLECVIVALVCLAFHVSLRSQSKPPKSLF